MAAAGAGAGAVAGVGEPPAWHALAGAAALAAASSSRAGLAHAEAAARLRAQGPNTLRAAPRKTLLRMAVEQLCNAVTAVLLGAATVAAVFKDWPDLGFILAVVAVNVGLGVALEGRAAAATAALAALAAPAALALRGGRRVAVDAAALVVGDVVALAAGDRVPADVRLLEAADLRVIEAPLTGESAPVAKRPAPVAADALLAERRGMAYMGTLVLDGDALALVVATGDRAEIGRINALMAGVKPAPTPLQRQIAGFGLALSLLCVAVAVLGFIVAKVGRGYATQHALEVAVGVAVALIPEGLPTVVTITLALGVTAMARARAVVRQLPAVETLGAVTVICSDKTGTLTKNEMTAVAIHTAAGDLRASGAGYHPYGRVFQEPHPAAGSSPPDTATAPPAAPPAAPAEPPPAPAATCPPPLSPESALALQRLLLPALLCNDATLMPVISAHAHTLLSSEPLSLPGLTADPENNAPTPGTAVGPEEKLEWYTTGDPTEAALLALAMKAGLNFRTQHELVQACPRVASLPFSSENKFMATVHDIPHEVLGSSLVGAAALHSLPSGIARPLSRGPSRSRPEPPTGTRRPSLRRHLSGHLSEAALAAARAAGADENALGPVLAALEAVAAHAAAEGGADEEDLGATDTADRNNNADGDYTRLMFVKGAPDVLLSRCTLQLSAAAIAGTSSDASAFFEPVDREAWSTANTALASQGMRVLALCQRTLPARAPVPSLTASCLDENPTLWHTGTAKTPAHAGPLVLLALVAIVDPPREEAVRAVQSCHAAGVRVKMITGDHAATARTIGSWLGIPATEVLTGHELEGMDDAGLEARAEKCHIYARASPEHKLRIVRALQKRGHIVAMTGDGVNDGPALRQANVGVAMGLAGTEVAREAARMVLQDDNFATLEVAVRLGRTVYDNLRKLLLFLLPTSVAQGFSVFVAVVVGVPSPLTQIQILFVNMITAATLGLVLATEPPEPGIMARPPRRPNKRLLGKFVLWRTVFTGFSLVAVMLGQYNWSIRRGDSARVANTMALNTLVLAQCFYCLSCRFLSRSSCSLAAVTGNRWLLAMMLLNISVQALLTYTPGIQGVWETASLGVLDWVRVVALALAVFIVVEIEKVYGPRFVRPRILPCLRAVEKFLCICECLGNPKRLSEKEGAGSLLPQPNSAGGDSSTVLDVVVQTQPSAEASSQPGDQVFVGESDV
jgi:magnesium-transporting ATPase (P-type)